MLVRDLKYAFRLLRNNAGFTAVVIATLALGIGANTAMFSVAEAVLLRRLPFRDPETIVVFHGIAALEFNSLGSDVARWSEWVEKSRTLEEIAVYQTGELNLAGAGEAERVPAVAVSRNFFPLLGISASRGRTFLPQELQPGYEPVALISYRLWRERYASDPGAVGRTIRLNGRPFTVVGVMPPEFGFPERSDVWLPLPMSPEQRLFSTAAIVVTQLGRLRRNATLLQAHAELELFAQQASEAHGETERPEIELATLHQHLVKNLRPSVLVLFAAVVLVLLIACANVANLLLARNSGRLREMAIRSAIGADRWNLIRQSLTESLLLSISGGAVGMLLGLGGTSLARHVAASAFPSGEIKFDSWVFFFALSAAMLTGLLCGLLPAWQLSNVDPNEALKEGATNSGFGLPTDSRRRLHGILGAGEIALAFMLLIGAGLLIRSLANLLQVDPGFRTNNLLTARIDLAGPGYATSQRRAAFFDRVTERLKLLPSVQSVALTNKVPLSKSLEVGFSCGIEGSRTPTAREGPMALYFSASSSYFSTMGIPFLSGRAFNDRDRAGAKRVVIVSRRMAAEFWPNQDPLGKRITIQDPPQWMEVVGVVGDVRTWDLGEEPWTEMYVPILQEPPDLVFLVVEAADVPRTGLALDIQSVVHSIDKDEPISSIRSVDEILAQSTGDPRFRTLLLGIFSSIALLLAAVGIYGIMAHSVSKRTHEIGIRMALGAERKDVLHMVVRQGTKLTLVGIVLGFAGGVGLTRFLSNFLYGVRAFDPTTFAGASLVLIGVALMASYIPARRATKVDPIVALRYE
jgi:putative ABC transport system permease protein